MNIKQVSRYVGIALLFNAIFMFISVFVSIIYGFDASFSPLLISAFITLAVGNFPLIFVRKSETVNLKEGFTITILSWVLSCLFGMLPFLLWGGEFTLINALFESVSGYTTTGSTILSNPEGLPKGLLFWRSSTHFIGGIGIVIFMLLVLPTMSTFKMRMSKMEISSLSRDNYKYVASNTVKVIAYVYLGITLLSTICLWIAGMDLFDAINHAFTIVSTGGFSTKNYSILSFNSFPIELVCMLFMLASGLHFGLIYSSFSSRTFKIFKSPIIRFYLFTVLTTSLMIAISIKNNGNVETWGMALRQAFFQVISISTTTGLATADTTLWASFPMVILIYLSIQSACSGSTAGGIKSDRVWIFYQSIKVQIKKLLHPNAVIPIKIGEHPLDKEVPSMASLYISLYLGITFLVTIILSALGLDFIDSFTSSVASIGNVGPGFGSVGSLSNYGHFPAFGKFILVIEMLLGRLEIYTLLMIFVLFKRN